MILLDQSIKGVLAFNLCCINSQKIFDLRQHIIQLLPVPQVSINFNQSQQQYKHYQKNPTRSLFKIRVLWTNMIVTFTSLKKNWTLLFDIRTEYFTKYWKLKKWKMLSQKLCSNFAKGARSPLFFYSLFFSIYFFHYCIVWQLNRTKQCKLFTFLFWYLSSQGYLHFFILFPQISDTLIKSGASQKDNERRQGFGVQEWDDGSRYEGEFMNGLKHGKGKYTWKTGEVRAKSFPTIICGKFPC